MTSTHVRVTTQPLTSEAFAPYGSILALKQPVFPEVDDGASMIMITRLTAAENPTHMEQMAIHFSYNQTFLPLSGSMAFVVAPPPEDASLPHDEYPLDYERLAAFVLEPGTGVLIDRGTWHQIMPLGGECVFLTSTRRGPEQIYDDGELTTGNRTDEERRRGSKHAPFIEIVDVAKRDGRVVELEI